MSSSIFSYAANGIIFIGVVSIFTTSASIRSARRQRTLIRDPALFAMKRAAVLAAGVRETHFVIDFDRTMTTYKVKGGARGDSCHGIIEKRPLIAEKAAALNAYYYAIEIDPARSPEAKTPFMIEWYGAVNNMIAVSGITRRDIAHDVSVARIELREGMRALLDASRDVGLPVTIFSAGIGDVIMEVLTQYWAGREPLSPEPLPRPLRVVSNWMQWGAPRDTSSYTISDSEAHPCTGWSLPLIHMYNKHSSALKATDFTELSKRRCVVLCGDSEGDVTMADGLDAEIVLRIGFLNSAATSPPHLIDLYARIYDVVLLDDAPAWEVSDLIRELLAEHDKF